MFLKNITLRHFKCHENLYIDFTAGATGKNQVRKTTFLTGRNGTGKSALLQAIAMVTGGSEALHSMQGFPDSYIQYGHDTCEITAIITTSQGEERILSLLLQRGESVEASVERAKTSLAPMDAALYHTHRSYFTAGYGSGRRANGEGLTRNRNYYPQRNRRYAAVHSLFGTNAPLRPLNVWIDELQHHGGTAAIAILGDALNTFLPDEVRFHSYIPAPGRLLFHTPDGVLPLELLSNGYQQTVAWVSDLLYHVTSTFGDYTSPLTARGLILIDEIDLHMHPAWQQRIYAFLTKGLPNFQVIATTCSSLTAQQAGAEELYSLRRSQEGKVVLESDNSEPLWMGLQHPLPADFINSISLNVETVKAPLWQGAGTRTRRIKAVPADTHDIADMQPDINGSDGSRRVAA